MLEHTATGTGRTRTVLTWVGANLVLGYVAAFPLLTTVVFSYYMRARLRGSVAAPFHAAEAQVAAAVIVVLGGLVVVTSLAVNRVLRRRLELRGSRAAGFWAATLAVQLTPFAWYLLATDRTFGALLGEGMFW